MLFALPHTVVQRSVPGLWGKRLERYRREHLAWRRSVVWGAALGDAYGGADSRALLHVSSASTQLLLLLLLFCLSNMTHSLFSKQPSSTREDSISRGVRKKTIGEALL